MLDNGHRVYYETQGSGPPVVMVHGIAASLRQWDYLTPNLVAAGFSAYALDLRGHGNSSKPEGTADYHIESVYEQLDRWIENLGLDQPAILVGHSLGGYLSLMYALRNPEKVHAMVLADPFYSPFQLSPVLRYFAKQPKIGVQMLERLPAWAVDLSMVWRDKFQRALPRPIRNQLSIDFKRASPLSFYIPHTVRDLTPHLSQVQKPTLVMWGSRDMTLTPTSFPKIVDALPKVESYIFQGCGHIPHLTQAANFNQLVLEFVTSRRTN